jgi:hypothetical protein
VISGSPDASSGARWPLDAVLIHEVGHALRLAHADEGGQAVHAAMDL